MYPKFYDEVESIKIQDPLADALGAFEDGIYQFDYIDLVKSTGHSCPTVAGAYLMTLMGLKALYANSELVARGDIKVEFKESMENGVTGVIANVISQITGATDKSGFKGFQGKFARHSLMSFNENINASVRLTRLDIKESVDIFYDPSSITPNPDMQVIMQKMSQETVNNDEIKEFRVLWQDRVKRIFENIEMVIRVEEV